MQQKILALVPSILGNDGNAVNERQLLEHLCNYGKCYVISIVPVSQVKNLSLIKNFKKSYHNLSSILFLPIPFVPIAPLFLSIILSPFIFLLDRAIKFHLIYIRPSLLSFGLLASNSLTKKTCIKYTAIHEDEVKNNLLAPSPILKILRTEPHYIMPVLNVSIPLWILPVVVYVVGQVETLLLRHTSFSYLPPGTRWGVDSYGTFK